jgi:hypothetical protein
MYLYALFWSGERQVAISLVTILTRDERLDPAAMGVVAYHHACMLYYCGLHWEADEVMYRNRDNVMHENSTSVSYFSLMIDNQRFMGAPWNAVMAMEYKFVAVQLNCHGYDALLATAKEIPHILEDLVKKYPGVTQFHDDICDNTMPALTRLIIRLVKCGLPYDVILPVMEKDEEMCVLLHQDWYVLQVGDKPTSQGWPMMRAF